MANQVATTSVDQNGDIGGEGVSRWHWVGQEGADIQPADVDTVAGLIHAFYTSIAQYLPPNLTYAIEPEVPVVDESSGKLVNLVSGSTVQSAIHGSSTGTQYPAGTGSRINWQTGLVVNGRRLRGAVYIVPLGDNAYSSQGAIQTPVQQALINAARTYNLGVQAAGCAQIVYHRPKKGETTGGVAALVNAWTVGSTPASLRSRRV